MSLTRWEFVGARNPNHRIPKQSPARSYERIIDRAANWGDSDDMKSTINTHSLLRAVSALPFAVLLSSHAFATPSDETHGKNAALHSFNPASGSYADRPAVRQAPSVARVAHSAEPPRIFDLEEGRFVANPDDRDSAAVRHVARPANAMTEPRRIFDIESGNFITNPAYHEPAPIAQRVRRVGEPRRIFDVVQGRFILNPDYREPAAVKQVAHNATPAVAGQPAISSESKGRHLANG